MNVLVLGSAASVWDDERAARELCEFDAVVAVNEAAVHYRGRVDVWATLHPEELWHWTAERAQDGREPARAFATHDPAPLSARSEPVHVLDYRWPGMGTQSGSSGLFAVKAALEVLDAERVVLAGVPMSTAEPHFNKGEPWAKGAPYLDAWRVALPFIRDRVRSLSGFTRNLLGAPTPDWINP